MKAKNLSQLYTHEEYDDTQHKDTFNRVEAPGSGHGRRRSRGVVFRSRGAAPPGRRGRARPRSHHAPPLPIWDDVHLLDLALALLEQVNLALVLRSTRHRMYRESR